MSRIQNLTAAGIALCAGLWLSAATAETGIDPDDILTDAELNRIAAQFQANAPHTVHFEFDKDTLTDTAKAQLREQARWIAMNRLVSFAVYGHTDKVGSNAYNIDLGLRRARNVVAYLVSLGIERERLTALVSRGEEMPVIQTEAREVANRRTTTFVNGRYAPEDLNLAALGAGQAAPRGSGTPVVQITPDPPDEPAAPAIEETGPGKSGKDNSDANGTGGNAHGRTDHDERPGQEIAEIKKGAE